MKTCTPLRVVAMMAAAFLLAGCQLRADVGLRLDEGGGGTIVVTVEADESLDEQARAAGLDLAGSLALATTEIDGWTAEVDGSRVELRTTVPDAEALREVSTSFADALATPELRPLEPFEVTVEDRRFRLDGAAALSPTAAVAELGYAREEAEALLRDNVRFTVTVEMPGEVVSHDADRSDGSLLVWDVGVGERRTITAESELPRLSGWLPLGVLAAGVALLVAGAAGLARRRRGR